jgi:2'-5' RNA ligase
LRLFFAVWPDTAARAALARLAGEVARDAGGRATRNESLHVTLAFLGSVPRERLPAALAAGERASQAAAPFRLSLERLGGGSYAIAWLTPDSTPAPLRSLHAALEATLRDAEFALERRMFRPHLTLVRDCVRRARRGALPPIAWDVTRLALVASTTAGGASRYTEVAAWPLAQASGIV